LIVPAPNLNYNKDVDSSENLFPTLYPQQSSTREDNCGSYKHNSNNSFDLPTIQTQKKLRAIAKQDFASQKLLNSPLYKSLKKSNSETTGSNGIKYALTQLNRVQDLRNIGNSEFQNHRSEHSVEKRMCNACWAEPTKVTRCQHGLRSYNSNSNSSIEMQV